MAAVVMAAAHPMLAHAQTGAVIIDQNRLDRAPAGAATKPNLTGQTSQQGSVQNQRNFTPFVLREIRVEGSTASADIVGAASRPFIGKTVDAKTLDQITQAVAASYARADVALYTVVVPEQDFSGGSLRLVVIEGYVENVVMHIQGAHGKLSLIKAYAAKMTHEKPLRRSTLERYLSLIRDIPGLAVQADFLRGDKPGAVTLALEGKQKTAEVGMAINNRGTAYLGRTQITVNVPLYSLLREGDRTELTFAAPTDISRFQYYAITHSQPIGTEGTTVTGSFGYLRTQPKGTALEGHAVLAGLQVTHPLIRSYNRQLYVTGAIDGLNSDNALLGQTIADERTRALRVALAYGKTGKKTSYSIGGTASFGLDGLGARVANPAVSETDFRKFSGRAGVDQHISPRWVVRLRGTGQVTGDRLPAAELFSLGGDEFGRGFEAAVVTGDSGYAGSAEMAFVFTQLPERFKGSEIYGFVDGGKVFVHARPGFVKTDYSLASGGFGGRLAVTKTSMLQLEAAKPLNDPFPGMDHSWRLIASVHSRF